MSFKICIITEHCVAKLSFSEQNYSMTERKKWETTAAVLSGGGQTLAKNLQQLSVEDPNDTGALRRVRGHTALTLLEGCWQLLDLVPLTNVLQREGRFSTCMHSFFPHRNGGKDFIFTLVASKLAWTSGLGHLPNLISWAPADRTDNVSKITCAAFISTCIEENRRDGQNNPLTASIVAEVDELPWLLTCMRAPHWLINSLLCKCSSFIDDPCREEEKKTPHWRECESWQLLTCSVFKHTYLRRNVLIHIHTLLVFICREAG